MRYDGLTEAEHKDTAKMINDMMNRMWYISGKYKKTGFVAKRAKKVYWLLIELRSDLDGAMYSDGFDSDGVYYGGDR